MREYIYRHNHSLYHIHTYIHTYNETKPNPKSLNKTLAHINPITYIHKFTMYICIRKVATKISKAILFCRYLETMALMFCQIIYFLCVL